MGTTDGDDEESLTGICAVDGVVCVAGSVREAEVVVELTIDTTGFVAGLVGG